MIPLVIADPPYNIGFDYSGEYDDSQTATEYKRFSESWLEQVSRVLTPTGAFWLIIGDEWQADLQLVCRSLGLHLRSHVVWLYTFGVNCTNKFTRSHAHCLYFTKHRTDFTFNAAQLKVPSARQLVYKDKRAKAGGRLPDDVWVLRPQDLGPGGFPATADTWHIPRVCGTYDERIAGAANQLPEQLVGRMIRGCSNPGDLVLDPMAGTGTVLAVARKLGRDYLGFDQSPMYCGLAADRLSQVQPGQVLAGATPQGG